MKFKVIRRLEGNREDVPETSSPYSVKYDLYEWKASNMDAGGGYFTYLCGNFNTPNDAKNYASQYKRDFTEEIFNV